jgi:phospholipase C
MKSDNTSTHGPGRAHEVANPSCVFDKTSGVLTAGVALLGILCSPSVLAEKTATPIGHVIVIIQENRTFDNYFGTYPHAANNPGEQSWIGVNAPSFTPLNVTMSVNGLTTELLTKNPNKTRTGQRANPKRLRPADSFTCDHSHAYVDEQHAVHGGLVDLYPQSTAGTGTGCETDGSSVMNYYDGNTVTALWNYAQHYAMSDNHFGAAYGPTLPGHLELVSGNTHGAVIHNATTSSNVYINPVDGSVTNINNFPPYLDDCGPDRGGTVVTPVQSMTGNNVGDLLNAKGVTWGYFQGGFLPTTPAVLDASGNMISPAVCGSSHVAHQMLIDGVTYSVPNPTIHPGSDIHSNSTDYSTGVCPLMQYPQSRNTHHLRPSSPSMIGKTDQANHLYDISDFFTALSVGSLPAVSYINAPVYQYGHPSSSDSLVEQAFLVQTINAVMKSKYWQLHDTAVVIAWDDSDGWYDHVMPPVLRPSATNLDSIPSAGMCGTPDAGADQARCGYGPRLPLLVISPWAKPNFVDHTLTDQVSVLRFIEDNWNLGFVDGPTAPPVGTGSSDRYAASLMNMFDFISEPDPARLILDPVTGTVVSDQ